MSGLAGLRPLVVLVGRLDRVRLAAWVGVLGLLPVAVGATFADLYPTEVSRAELVGTVEGATALTAILGPVRGTSVGALVAWRVGTIGALVAALVAGFTVVRHTRADEESGRAELVGAAVVGRHAPLLAAVAATAAAGLAIGLLTTLGLVLLGEEAAGSVALGLAWALVVAVAAALGGVAAQLSTSARGARLLLGGTLGVLFALRMVGDSLADDGLGWLAWLSPFGWVGEVHAFADERWSVLVLAAAVGALLLALAVALEGRRDLGAGLVTTRRGPAEAAGGLASVGGLARRLHGRSLVGWTVAIAAFAGLWGVLTDTVGALLEENPRLAEIVATVGGEVALEDAFLATAFSFVAIAVAAQAIAAVLQLREEEESGRAELVLATATDRLRWAGSHVASAVLGPVLLLGVAGVAATLTVTAVTGGSDGLPGRMAQLALAQVPAVWVVAATAVALVGLQPRWATWSWGVLVAALLVGLLGEVLQLPQLVLDLSPFTHVPTPPDELTAGPMVGLTVVAAGLTAAGLAGLRRRDVG